MKKFTKEISALLVTVTAGTIAGGGVNALETAEQPLTGDIAPSSSCDITEDGEYPTEGVAADPPYEVTEVTEEPPLAGEAMPTYDVTEVTEEPPLGGVPLLSH